MTKIDPIDVGRARPARSFKGLRVITALTMREMGTTYGKSPGGYVWAILEPLASITLFTLVIAVGLRVRSPSLGSNFMLFYATGFLPFQLAMQANVKTAKSLRYSRQLLKYPRVTFVDAIASRFILHIFTQLIVFLTLMSGIHYFFSIDPILNMGAIFISLSMAAILGLGAGCLNCFLMNFFPVWENIWAVLTRPLLLLSTVIYIFEEVPWRYQDVVWFNPFVHIIGMMRRGFYGDYDATYVSPAYVFGIGLSLMAIGMLCMYRWNKVLINRG